MHIGELTNPTVVLGSNSLSIEEVVGVARYGWKVAEFRSNNGNEETNRAYERAVLSYQWIKEATDDENQPAYYGINTGFGSKAGRTPLPKDDIPWVSRNLIVSHSTGVGRFLDPEIVRAAMLLRANSLAKGYSGVRIELINLIVKMLNEGVCPVVPEYGSVGASGDLAPLSHLGLVLSKRPSTRPNISTQAKDYDEGGQAYIEKRDNLTLETVLITEANGYKVEYALLNGHEAMRKRGLEPLVLGAKEGLAFNNGATFSAAIATLAIYDAENLVRHAEVAAALSLESLLGFRDAFLPHIQQIRHHQGQIEVAERITKFIAESTLVDGDVDVNPLYIPPQDAYSIRVTPQVIGAVWDTLRFIKQTVSREINAATDNPLVFNLPKNDALHLPRSYRVVSGGNFHGAPLAYAMDFLSIVVTDLGSLSERRTFRLTDPVLSQGLPAMLLEEEKSGQTSGMMIPQYLAAGLVSECKTLSHPDSVDSIPTSANQEDHVSMSMNAALHARKVVENIEYVIVVELLCATLGLDWRIKDLKKKKIGEGYQDEKAKPENKKVEDRNRIDEKILFLRTGFEPRLGKGSKVAFDLIQQKLYEKGNALPELGGRPTSEDRYLRPYVLRLAELLKSQIVVQRIYELCDIEFS